MDKSSIDNDDETQDIIQQPQEYRTTSIVVVIIIDTHPNIQSHRGPEQRGPITIEYSISTIAIL
jgi:hypothetical protein